MRSHALKIPITIALVCCGVAIAAPHAFTAQFQAPRITTTSRSGPSGTMPISAVTMATFMTDRIDADEALVLLVLWRGSAGWYAKGGRSGSSGGGNASIDRERFWEGSYEFEVTVDRTKRVARVLDTDIDLNKANVVFIDEVDSKPRIVKTALVKSTIDATQPSGPDRELTFFGQLPEVREYVQCETRLPDERMQARLAPICARMMQSAPSR
jgi:hypothetical protein